MTDETLPIASPLEQKPPRVPPRIIAAPKIRQMYWCDFPRDAQLPEMWKTRPVIVVSYKNTLTGPCLIVPTTTDPQGNSPWAYQLSPYMDGQINWAICNHLYTVAPSRFGQVRGRIPSVTETEFNEILRRITMWLPKPFDLDKN